MRTATCKTTAALKKKPLQRHPRRGSNKPFSTSRISASKKTNPHSVLSGCHSPPGSRDTVAPRPATMGDNDDDMVTIRAHHKKVRPADVGLRGRAGPGGAGRRAIRGEVTRAARADRRGHDHASEEGHAHGRGLQTVRGEEGPPGEVPELRRAPRPRTRLSEDGGKKGPPAAADAAAPQVAGGKTIPNDAKPMDLKKTVSEPARAPRPARRARDGPRRARARPGGGGGDDDPPRRCQRRP